MNSFPNVYSSHPFYTYLYLAWGHLTRPFSLIACCVTGFTDR